MVEEKKVLEANQEIIGGLKSAIIRGETLKQAMMTFYAAGYKKEEIEDAAKAYLYLKQGEAKQTKPINNSVPQDIQSKPEEKKEDTSMKEMPSQKIVGRDTTKKISFMGKIFNRNKPKVVQRVSEYKIPNKTINPPGKTATIVLIIVLGILLAILVAVFLFKTELVEFFNGLFG